MPHSPTRTRSQVGMAWHAAQLPTPRHRVTIIQGAPQLIDAALARSQVEKKETDPPALIPILDSDPGPWTLSAGTTSPCLGLVSLVQTDGWCEKRHVNLAQGPIQLMTVLCLVPTQSWDQAPPVCHVVCRHCPL